MLTQVHIETTPLILHIELQGTRSEPASPLDVGNQLAAAGFASGIAALQGSEGGLNEHAVIRAEPRLMQAKFGSPLVFDIALPGGLVENALGLTFLIYAFKRLWGLPIELRTHRERLRRDFYEAEQEAEKARRKAQELGVRQRHRLDGEMGWQAGSSWLLEEKKTSAQGWEGFRGELSGDD